MAFTGHWFHAPSTLSFALFREYSADNAKWLSRDPVMETDNINLYLYAANNPINTTDNFGLFGLDTIAKYAGNYLLRKVEQQFSPTHHASNFLKNAILNYGFPDISDEDEGRWRRDLENNSRKKSDDDRKAAENRECKQKWDNFSDPSTSPWNSAVNPYPPYNPSYTPFDNSNLKSSPGTSFDYPIEESYKDIPR